MAKKTLSYAEHLEVAARVKEARKLLHDILGRVSKGLGTSSKASKLAYQIVLKFDEGLKNELEEALFRDCKNLPSVDREQLTAVYYAPTKDSKVVLHRSRKSDS